MFPHQINHKKVSKESSSDKLISLTSSGVNIRRSDVMAKMLISGFMSDCNFVVGPDEETAETIPGHKIMFVLASPVFECMFNSDFKELQANADVRIEDLEPRHFKNFRYIIYNNDASFLDTLSIEDLLEVYKICDKYLVTTINNYIIDYLTKTLPNMNVKEVILTFQFSQFIEETDLLQHVKEKIRIMDIRRSNICNKLNENDFYELLLTLKEGTRALQMFSLIEAYFKNKKLLQAPEELDTKSEIKKDDKDNIKLPQDTHQNSNHNDNLLKKYLKCIDFKLFSCSDFKRGPGESNILTFEQKYYILSRLDGSTTSLFLQ